MAKPPPADEGLGPIGCFFALAIGVLIVGGEAGAFSLLTGRSLNLGDEWAVFLLQMLFVAAPFGMLAVMDVGRWLPWLVGLALTLGLWGYVLFDGVSYQWHSDGGGANIGLGLFILVSPVPIAAACLGAHAWQRRAMTHVIEPETIAQLRLVEIETVTFYKRDEITTDLICCEIDVGGRIWFFHEEMEGWNALVQHLERLPGFRADWFGAVSQPPFELSLTVAYRRS